ncbi:MAG TPA: ADP-ribosylation factor-like protein [Candidatus Deferrimicrobium sp.]|nr:ADP-ribosylation factor-like protein [Candidatus Deferrimicrobium sp.]
MVELSGLVEDLILAKSEEAILEKIKNFLEPTVDGLDNIKKISNLPIQSFKDLNSDEAELISELLKVRTIKDLASVTYKQLINVMAYLREGGISRKKIELIITAAKYITHAADYKPIEGQKIVVAGLDNAGKTALLQVISKKFTGVCSLKPTQGMEVNKCYLEDQELIIFELGGQELYRKMYIENPEKYILATDIIVFLIDIQDGERYQEALEYLKQILELIKYLNENPTFIILLHKSDPELIRKQPLVQEKIDYIKEKVEEVFDLYIFQYDIQASSIFCDITMAPSFLDMLKGLFSGDVEQETKFQAINRVFEGLVDVIFNIESKLTEQIDIFRSNLYQLNRVVRKHLTPDIKDSEIKPQLIPALASTPIELNLNVRSLMIEELRKFFEKKKK